MRAQPDDAQRDREDIWRILCHIVACKSRRRVTRQTRGPRGGRVRPLTDLEPASGELPLSDRLGSVSPQEFDVCLEEALERLDPTLRQIALLTMEGWTQAEIAERLDCSRRTVIRKLELVRGSLAELVE